MLWMQRGVWLWWQGRRGGCSGRVIWCCLLGLWMLLMMTQMILLQPPYLDHPALSRRCYEVRGIPYYTNTCCRLHNYTKGDVLSCVGNAHMTSLLSTRYKIETRGKHTLAKHRSHLETPSSIHSPNEYLLKFFKAIPQNYSFSTSSVSPPHPDSERPDLTWVMVGDSRVRQVFSALVTRLSSPRLHYRKPSTMGKWRSIHELTENLRIGKLHENIEVHHLDFPLRLLFYWDPLLTLLPKLLSQWVDNIQPHPALLVIGSGLHWMKNAASPKSFESPASAFDRFRQHMTSLLPLLAQQAKSTHIILLLQDHVQESQIFKKYLNIYSNNIIDQYNTFFSSYVSGTDITLWDSNIPFSDAYYVQCRQDYKNSYDMSWNCANPLHSGYVAVEMYINMLLNDICNPFLHLDSGYC
ncbi:hypothetical protein O3P69_001639 [Scylla paramamosain]|uniref:Uncharacterized protein n=2 Tax=Scylla paramamosain TaxID=85552 RepID=A0AAW0V028_SCYPA